MKPKPRIAKVKLTRNVTEIAIVSMDRDGNIEEIDEIHEELDWCDADILDVRSVLSVYP